MQELSQKFQDIYNILHIGTVKHITQKNFQENTILVSIIKIYEFIAINKWCEG